MEVNVLLPDQMIESLDYKHAFTVRKIGYYEKPKHPNMQRMGTQEAIIILCMDGCGYVEYKGKHYVLKQGDVAFLEPDCAHKYGSKNDRLWTILWAHFTGEGVRYLSDCLEKYGLDHVFHLQNYQHFAEELHYIIYVLQNFSNAIDVHKACSLFQLAMLNLIGTLTPRSEHDNLYIKEAVEIMKTNIYNNITLEDICSRLGITSYHLIRIFKANLTITPMQYYYSLKLNEAIHLLLSTDLSVAEISQQLRYTNPFYFSQQFKKKTGYSPTAYKKLMCHQLG